MSGLLQDHPTDLSSSSLSEKHVTQRWSWFGSEMPFFLFSSSTPLVRKLVAAVPPSPLWQQLWMAGCPALSSLSEARTAAVFTGHRKDPECHKTRWLHFSHCISIWLTYCNAVWQKVGKLKPLLSCCIPIRTDPPDLVGVFKSLILCPSMDLLYRCWMCPASNV